MRLAAEQAQLLHARTGQLVLAAAVPAPARLQQPYKLVCSGMSAATSKAMVRTHLQGWLTAEAAAKRGLARVIVCADMHLLLQGLAER